MRLELAFHTPGEMWGQKWNNNKSKISKKIKVKVIYLENKKNKGHIYTKKHMQVEKVMFKTY